MAATGARFCAASLKAGSTNRARASNRLSASGSASDANRPSNLARDAQRLAAGGENRDVWAEFEKGLTELRALVDEVLAVVEDKQCAAPCQPGRDNLGGRCAAGKLEVRHHGAADVGLGGELHPPRPVWPGITTTSRDLDREPGLAGASGAGKRHQARSSHERLQCAQVAVATDKAGEMLGQLPGRRRRVAPAGHRIHRAIFSQVDGDSKMRRRCTRKRGIGGSLSPDGAPLGMKGACIGTP